MVNNYYSVSNDGGRMTVKQLREMLKSVPDNYNVILSKDGEGNEFKPIKAYSFGEYSDGTFYDSIHPDSPIERNTLCLWPV